MHGGLSGWLDLNCDLAHLGFLSFLSLLSLGGLGLFSFLGLLGFAFGGVLWRRLELQLSLSTEGGQKGPRTFPTFPELSAKGPNLYLILGPYDQLPALKKKCL